MRDAIAALHLPDAASSTTLTGILHVGEAKERQLLRVVEMAIGSAMTASFARWQRFIEIIDTAELLEDDIFSLQRELKRSHAMLQATLQQQMQAAQAHAQQQAQLQERILHQSKQLNETGSKPKSGPVGARAAKRSSTTPRP